MPVKADIDFEKELWDAANELRGAVAENEYKNYVLPLIFIRHISDRFDIVRIGLESKLNDPKSDYYTTDPKEISMVMEDPDEYGQKNTIKLPEEAHWDFLRINAEQDDIKLKVDNALETIQEKLIEYHGDKVAGILPRIYVKSELTPRQVGGIINLFSHTKFSEKENPESDILGRVYEYYLGKFAAVEGYGAGNFFTPGSIVRLLVEMLEPFKGRIFDPACGSGGMFVQSSKFLKEHEGSKENISIYGQERYSQTMRLCIMNLLLRDLQFDIRLGNSLLDDKFPDLKADFVISNPPFNVSQWHPEDLPEHDPRLLGPRDDFTTDSNANYMWMQTFWSHLSDTGTAGYVMANGAMTTNNKGERNIREQMVENNMIDCIVRMPDKLFMSTGIPACLFFLSKNRKGNDKLHRNRLDEVLFIDASKMGKMASRRLRVFEDNDIKRVAGTYHNWRNKDGNYEDVPGFCKSASILDIKANDYKLTPGIYVGTENVEDDGVPFEEKMEKLKAKLKDQFEKSNELQEKILTNFSKLK